MGDLRTNHGNRERMTGDVNIFLALTVSISDRQGTVIFAFGLMYFDVLGWRR